MSDKETLSVYAQKAQDYAEMVTDIAEEDPSFEIFVKAVPKGGEVLDLGSGPGHYAARMAAAGLKVTAFDPVPQMVALADKHDGVTAQQAGFDDVNGISIYDGVWANFSLLHAPRADMPRHLKHIHEALKVGGQFHIGVKTGEGEHRDGLGRLYTYYTIEELTGLLEAAGFTVTESRTGSDAGLSGEVAHWVCLSAHA